MLLKGERIMKTYEVGDKIKLKQEYHPFSEKLFKNIQIVSILSDEMYLVREEFGPEVTITKDEIETLIYKNKK